jgi:genome maintenance exonuclease 1
LEGYEINRVQENGLRFYRVTKGDEEVAKLPSVTTVLGNTKDMSGLEKWKKRVGEAEANRISTLSMNRGTIMHRLIELYKGETSGEPEERLAQLKEISKEDEEVNQFKDEELGAFFLQQAWTFFYKFYYNHDVYFDRINEVLEAETFLWTTKGGGWAGTVDNISELVDNKIMIIDYKNSRKPKQEKWIQDYFLQAAAYFIAYWDRTGIKADGAEIWIANEIDNLPQTFSLTQRDLEFYAKEFMKRRKTFKEKFDI